MSDVRQPVRFYNQGHLAFSSCCFLGNPSENLAPWFAAFKNFDQVTFQDCWVREASVPQPNGKNLSYLRTSYKTQALDALDRTLVPAGALIAAADHPDRLFRVSARMKDIPLTDSGSLDILVKSDPQLGFAVFTADHAEELLKPGDVVYASGDGWRQQIYREPLYESQNHGACGVVLKVEGTTVTLTAVAQGLMIQLGSLSRMKLSVRYTPRFHLETRGDLKQGSAVIQLVPPHSVWLPKDRIWGDGIPPGAFVKELSPVDPHQLTISAPATKTATGVRLYDAEVCQFTGTPV
jgi:hypothetical protein